MRSLLHLRQILTGLGVWLVPSQVTVSRAHQAFGPEGEINDPEIHAEVVGLVDLLIRQSGRLKEDR